MQVIVQVGEVLGLDTVAEGIETPEQLLLLDVSAAGLSGFPLPRPRAS